MTNPALAETLRRIGRDLRAWTPGEAAPVLAVRAACGIAAVMIAVQLLGAPGWGTAAIMGAWLGGVGLLTPGTRTGPSVPLLIGLGGAGGLLLGAIDPPLLLIAASAAYALGMTYIGSLSQATGVVVTVSGILFFLSDHLTEYDTAWVAALAVCAGGAVQALMTLLPPYYRWAEDRAILAEAWRALATEAEALADDPYAPFHTDPLLRAAQMLRIRRVLPEAIHDARSQIYALSGAITRVAAARARANASDSDHVALHGEALRLTAGLLRHFADQITARRGKPIDWDELLAELGQHPVATSTGSIPTDISGLLRALHQTDGYAARIVTGTSGLVVSSVFGHATLRVWESIHELHGQLHWRSPSVQHALRRAGVIALAVAVGLVWPTTHGYWIPLTAWIVLQADFAGTLTRGITRATGTVGGVLAASLLSFVVPHSVIWISAVILVFALLAYVMRPVSMLLFAAAVSGFTVFNIDLTGEDALAAALDRGASTLVGALLAIGFYALAPTWQTRRLGDLLADLVDAYRAYARLALAHQAHPSDYDRRLMHTVVDDVRGARQMLTTAADQAAAEPIDVPKPWSADALGAEEALSRAARALVTINSSVQREDAPELPAIDDFTDAVDAAYRRLAALARGEDPPLPVDLATAARRLEAALSEGSGETRTRRSIVLWEVDNLVEALDDAGHLMADWGRPGGAA